MRLRPRSPLRARFFPGVQATVLMDAADCWPNAPAPRIPLDRRSLACFREWRGAVSNMSPCAGKTGEVLRMEVSYGEGVASHAGPESCAVVREDRGEALTGERAGRVSSRENFGPLRGADAVETGGRPHRARRHRETRTDPARSETPSTHGSTSHGNREVPRPPAAREAGGRTGKSKGIRR